MVHVVEQVGVALVEGGADAQVVADCTRGNVGVGAVGEELFEFVGAGHDEGTEEAGGETDGDGAAETNSRDGGVEGFCVRVGDGAPRVVVLWHFSLGYVGCLWCLEA